MLTFIKSKMRRFRREEDGSIIAETVIMMPTLFAAVMAMFVFFDAYRNQAINVKANFTISDFLSREDDYITNTLLVNTWNLHRFLTNSQNLTRLRISIVQYDADEDTYDVVWSRTKGGGVAVTWGELSEIDISRNEIPIMPDKERVVVVQSEVDYRPKFLIGLTNFTFKDMIFTRPRFGQGLCYSEHGSDAGRICPLDDAS